MAISVAHRFRDWFDSAIDEDPLLRSHILSRTAKHSTDYLKNQRAVIRQLQGDGRALADAIGRIDVGTFLAVDRTDHRELFLQIRQISARVWDYQRPDQGGG